MDRKFVYPGQIPLETDLLGTNQYAMVGLAKLSAAIFGTGGVVNGLVVAPNSPAALNVVVGSGEIYQLQNLEATAYSSLPADTTNTCVKQGIQLGSVVLACPAPTTAGFSVNYLIEATYADADINPVTLPYYNASNPAQAYSGPNNTGVQQATTRAGQVQLQVKAGIAATTGTQTTPAVDTGYIALAVVTVANGQATITAGNITASTGGQILQGAVSSGRLLNVQIFTASGTYVPTPGTRSIVVEGIGGGGGGGGAPNPGAGAASAAGGGSSGSFGRARIMSPVTTAVTIGSGGPGNSAAAGGNGSATTFGAGVSFPGGGGAPVATASSTASVTGSTGGAASVPTGANILAVQGAIGLPGFCVAAASAQSGAGGTTAYGTGGSGIGSNGTSSIAGQAAVGFGAGGSGAVNVGSGSGTAGGAGKAGVLIISEYA